MLVIVKKVADLQFVRSFVRGVNDNVGSGYGYVQSAAEMRV